MAFAESEPTSGIGSRHLRLVETTEDRDVVPEQIISSEKQAEYAPPPRVSKFGSEALSILYRDGFDF